MTPAEVYDKWQSTITQPSDSLFYYHPDLERILLGLALFVLTPQPALNKLGKAEPLKILHLQLPGLITAWIDDDGESFETQFSKLMPIAEAYLRIASAFRQKYPARSKAIEEVMAFYANAVASGGDMSPAIAEALLDDLTTDGRKIHSAKIASFGLKLLALTRQYSVDIPNSRMNELNGWQ
jgi:hypothetical protein